MSPETLIVAIIFGVPLVTAALVGLIAALVGMGKQIAYLEQKDRYFGVNMSELREDLAACHRRLAYLESEAAALRQRWQDDASSADWWKLGHELEPDK
jgi:hypothetical protein